MKVKYEKILSLLICFMLILQILLCNIKVEAINIPTLTAVANNEDIGSVSLNWHYNSSTGAFYKGYSSTDGGATWSTIPMIDFNNIQTQDKIKVLQVYPDVGENQLRDWLVNSGYGKNLITVSTVSITQFNNYPERYLYRTPDGWNYDVIFFGTWDSNNGKDLSAYSARVVEQFILDGRGCILGHDTISTAISHYNFSSLTPYFNIDIPASFSYGISDKVRIEKKGLFSTYPWNIGDIGTILTIPSAHVYQQYAKGDIWLTFIGVNNVGCNNFYLTTYNNCAMIQTGHKKD